MTVKRGGMARSKRTREAKKYVATGAEETAPAAPELTERNLEVIAAKRRHNEYMTEIGETPKFNVGDGTTAYGNTEFELGSSEAETAEVGAVGQDEVGVPSMGDERNKGKRGDEMSKGKRQGGEKGSGKRGEKGGLYGRLAKATGTTRKEGRGIMKRARRQIRSGNTKAGARRITRALAGGPKAGVKRTPARKAQAQAAGKKIAKRIAAKQDTNRKTSGGYGKSKKRK